MKSTSLKVLMKGLTESEAPDIQVNSCTTDSRTVHAGSVFVAIKGIRQRVEVLSRNGLMLLQHVKDFIAGVFVSIKHDREIGVVGYNMSLLFTKFDAFDIG